MAKLSRFIMPLLSEMYDDHEKIYEFHSEDELLNCSFVKSLRLTIEGKPDKYFYRYVLDGDKLMVETNLGVIVEVGTITGVHNLTFPKRVSNDENTKKCQDSFNIS